MALEASEIEERTIDEQFVVEFDYPEINKVMRIIKENDLNVVDQKLELDCKVYLSVRKSESEKILQKFKQIYKVDIRKTEDQ